MIILPVFTQNTCFTYVIRLDGTDYTLKFSWNPVAGAWYIAFEGLTDPARLVPNVNLLEYTAGPVPPGILMLVPMGANAKLNYSLENHRLVYYARDEIQNVAKPVLTVEDR